MTLPPMIDTHCHLTFERYDEDRDAVIAAAHHAGVTRIIIPAIDTETTPTNLALAAAHEGIFAAAGVHPNSTATFDDAILNVVRQQATQVGVIAIGEIGLDYHWDKSPKAQQHAAFEAQLNLASELELPVIIHNREASEDVLTILERWVAGLPPALRERPGVLHSFSAPDWAAERALAIGFYVGFTGPVTFKKADDLRAIVRQVPLERILVETDGPFLTPEPYRGKRNQPAYIPHIVDRLAGLKNITTEEMARITTANAERLFKLPD